MHNLRLAKDKIVTFPVLYLQAKLQTAFTIAYYDAVSKAEVI
jgi:hypothetical protein